MEFLVVFKVFLCYFLCYFLQEGWLCFCRWPEAEFFLLLALLLAITCSIASFLLIPLSFSLTFFNKPDLKVNLASSLEAFSSETQVLLETLHSFELERLPS